MLNSDRFGIFQFDVADYISDIEKRRLHVGVYFIVGEFCHIVENLIEVSQTIIFLVIIIKNIQKKIHYMEDLTANYDGMTLVVALSYSSRLELSSVTRQIAQDVKDGKLNADEITEQTISDRLWTSFMPDPELLIRTGGELRISNYLLWQIAYSELYFCDTYWPDFMEDDLYKAILSYQSRQRRFGKTEAQVEAEEVKGEEVKGEEVKGEK